MCFVSGNKVAWVCPLSGSVYLSWEPPTQSLALIVKLSFWGSREWGLSDFVKREKGSPPTPDFLLHYQETRSKGCNEASLQRWGNLTVLQQCQVKPQVPRAEDFSSGHLRGARRESEASLWRLKNSEDPEDGHSLALEPQVSEECKGIPYTFYQLTAYASAFFLSLSTQFLLNNYHY